MAENERKEETGPEKFPELEMVCPECKGDTDYNGNPSGQWRPCGYCDGLGHIPTDFGEKGAGAVSTPLSLGADYGIVFGRNRSAV
jgi:hypothetical protein